MHSYVIYLSLFLNGLALGWLFYLNRLLLREFPGRSTIESMRLELGETAGNLADLGDRFTRFQRREGMRAARAEKTSQADLQAEAQRILAEAGVSPASAGLPDNSAGSKTALYAKATKLRGH